MKFLKSKIFVAFVLAAISFAAFSFNTVPVEAKVTVSKVNYTPLLFQDLPAAELRNADAQAVTAAARAAAEAARRVAEAVAAGILANLLSRAVFGEVPIEVETYAIDSLDHK